MHDWDSAVLVQTAQTVENELEERKVFHTLEGQGGTDNGRSRLLHARQEVKEMALQLADLNYPGEERRLVEREHR